MSQTLISPCRCGAEVGIKKEKLWHGSHGYPGCYSYFIKCDKCGCTIDFTKNDTVYRSKEEAIENVINTWNKVYGPIVDVHEISDLCNSCIHKDVCKKLYTKPITGCKDLLSKKFVLYIDCEYGSYFYVVNDKIREHCCCGYGKDGTPTDENGKNYSEDEYTLSFEFAVKKWAAINNRPDVDIPFLFANGYVESIRSKENGERTVERSD